MKPFFYIITLIMLCLTMSSCLGGGIYNYIVSNNSSQEINLILYPDEKDVTVDYDCECYNHSYQNHNEYWYDVRYLGNDDKDMDCPLHSIFLKSGESIKFTRPVDEFNTNPDIPDTYAIWLRQNCLKQILIGEDGEIKNSELPCDYWSKSSNWIIKNKKVDSIEYWLIIDDEVIREHSIDNP